MSFALKRIYDQPLAADGLRILVDRIWPRGMTKEEARVELWLKKIAPSTELRKWFAHDPAKWTTFRERYFVELSHAPDAVAQLRTLAEHQLVTLLHSAKDDKHNNAVALLEYICRHAG